MQAFYEKNLKEMLFFITLPNYEAKDIVTP